MGKSILNTKRNCWKIVNIERLSLLFDSCEYFEAFFQLTEKAKRSIIVVGWEVEAKVGLRHLKDSYPDNLRRYFNGLTKRSKKLRVLVSAWKPALYLKFDREFFSPAKWKWQSSPRVKHSLKRAPYVFGSYHEKVTILDHSCAFMGGIDITKHRWDTRSHSIRESDRVDDDGTTYHPTHDLQMVLSGEVVDVLEEFVSTRVDVEGPSRGKEDLWPAETSPQLEGVRGALARTDGEKKKFEIEAFYLDAIASADDYIYIENQYYSHEKINDALVKKLLEEGGPEVVINLPYNYPGFFERAVFSHARNKALRKLIAADARNRLRVVYPSQKEENEKNYIIVHSKFMAVDDRLFTMGSANLNNRSMSVDQELNICLEAKDNVEIKKFINDSVSEVLAEHLNIPRERFSLAWSGKGSLVKAIDCHKGKGAKTLRLLPLKPIPFYEAIFLFIAPFVDVKFLLPKERFNILVILGFTFIAVAAKVLYDA